MLTVCVNMTKLVLRMTTIARGTKSQDLICLCKQRKTSFKGSSINKMLRINDTRRETHLQYKENKRVNIPELCSFGSE